ncbi:hypothetical protein N7491_008662, partial [Penicillium cf. griseofulvum]
NTNEFEDGRSSGIDRSRGSDWASVITKNLVTPSTSMPQPTSPLPTFPLPNFDSWLSNQVSL